MRSMPTCRRTEAFCADPISRHIESFGMHRLPADRNFRVTTNQAPGGGIMLLEMLGALENFDLRSIGHNSVEYVRVVAEAMKAATRDKDMFIGDPSFVDVPTERLISRAYCAELAAGIKRGEK